MGYDIIGIEWNITTMGYMVPESGAYPAYISLFHFSASSILQNCRQRHGEHDDEAVDLGRPFFGGL